MRKSSGGRRGCSPCIAAAFFENNPLCGGDVSTEGVSRAGVKRTRDFRITKAKDAAADWLGCRKTCAHTAARLGLYRAVGACNSLKERESRNPLEAGHKH